MFSSDPPLDELLEQALSISDRNKRDAWLQSICGEDLEKLHELKSLICASERTLWIDTPLKDVRLEIQRGQELVGVHVGPFELVRRIGNGGMGEVFLAQQHKPVKRLVAVKMIQQDLESTQILQRFQSEQQTLANMEHPNIARIIDAGIADSGVHYIAMEYVHGEQLLDYVHSKALDVRDKVRLMLQCCRAIQHAHQKGTIHRDIKPSNVLVTLVDGEPLVKVIDFGIAKALVATSFPEDFPGPDEIFKGAVSNGTATGVSPGTPRFMSPEQYSSSNPTRIDTRSDIYSLGALFYNLLVDVPPFDDLPVDELSLEQLREAITKNDPLSPSVRLPEAAKILRGDLDAIVLKAMERDPEDRYQTVDELCWDLQAFLGGLPVKANPESAWTQTVRLVRRHKILIGSTILAMSGLILGLILSLVQERRAIASERLAKRQAYGSDLLLASMANSKGNYSLSKEILARHALGGTSDGTEQIAEQRVQRLDWRLLDSQLPQDPTSLGHFATKIYYGLNIPERREIACGSKDSHLRVLHTTTGQLRLDIDTKQKEINGLARSPDGKTVATAGDDGTVKFWDLGSGEQTGSFTASTDAAIYQVGWSADGKKFLTAGNQPNISIWSLPSFDLEQVLESSGEDLECLDIGRQGQVAYGSDSGGVRIAYLSDSREPEIQSISVFTARAFNVNRVSTVVFSPSGRMLAVGLDNGYLMLLREREAKYHVVERIRFPSTVTAIAFQSDESKIAVGEANGSVHALNLPNDWPTRSRLRFTKYFLDENSRALSQLDPDDPDSIWRLVSRSSPQSPGVDLALDQDRVYLEFSEQFKNVFFTDNYIREWTDDAGNAKQTWSEIPKAVVFKENGIELQFENRYSGWSDAKDLETQGRLISWASHSKRVASVVWDELDNRLISFSEDGFVRAVKAELTGAMRVGGEDVSLFFPLSGSRVLIHKTDYTAMILTLDAQHNEPITTEPLPSWSYVSHGVTISGKDRLLIPAVQPGTNIPVSNPNALYIWDLESKDFFLSTIIPEPLNFRFFGGEITGDRVVIVADKPHEKSESLKRVEFLVFCDRSSGNVVWESELNQIGHRNLRVSPKGRFISYLKDRQIRLIRVENKKDVPLDDFSGSHIYATCFSPDERFLVAAISDNTIVCYRTSDGKKVWSLRTAGGPVVDLTWSKDAETLVCVSQDSFLRILDSVLGQMTAEIPLQINNPTGVKLSPEEDWIYVLGRDGTLIRIPCR